MAPGPFLAFLPHLRFQSQTCVLALSEPSKARLMTFGHGRHLVRGGLSSLIIGQSKIEGF
jgi:hypothetical protein